MEENKYYSLGYFDGLFGIWHSHIGYDSIANERLFTYKTNQNMKSFSRINVKVRRWWYEY